MENNCINLYKGQLCYLTFLHHNGQLIGCPCAYPQNCTECKDYKPKNQMI